MVRLREPGIGQDWIGRERYVVRGGGLVAVPVMPGDTLEIIDPEGLQSALVFGFNSRGENTTAALGISVEMPGASLAELLDADSPGAGRILGKLLQFGINPAEQKTARVMTGETPAGTRIEMTGESEMIVLVAAPGGPMQVDEHTPATDLVLFVRRLDPGFQLENDLPDPLADEVQSFRIDAGTATAYEVRKGEYIQILDVDGRQCSDFQCFDMAKLEKGQMRFLDATTT